MPAVISLIEMWPDCFTASCVADVVSKLFSRDLLFKGPEKRGKESSSVAFFFFFF